MSEPDANPKKINKINTAKNNQISELINKTNSLIGGYCVSECKAQCCKRYNLVITEDEMKKINLPGNAFFKDKLKDKLKKRFGGGYLLDIENGCCFLDKENKCAVYGERPAVCRLSPFVIDEEIKIIKVSGECPAVKNKMIDKIFLSFEKNGWKVFLCKEGNLGVRLIRWKKLGVYGQFS